MTSLVIHIPIPDNAMSRGEIRDLLEKEQKRFNDQGFSNVIAVPDYTKKGSYEFTVLDSENLDRSFTI